jgi:hypothetical protein
LVFSFFFENKKYKDELLSLPTTFLRAIYLACMIIPPAALDLSNEVDLLMRKDALLFVKHWQTHILVPFLAERVILTLAPRA